jgi:hypothetical protein
MDEGETEGTFSAAGIFDVLRANMRFERTEASVVGTKRNRMRTDSEPEDEQQDDSEPEDDQQDESDSQDDDQQDESLVYDDAHGSMDSYSRDEMQLDEMRDAMIASISWSALHKGIEDWTRTSASNETERSSRMHLANSWLQWIGEGQRSFMGALEMPVELTATMEQMLRKVISVEQAVQSSSSYPVDALGEDDEYDLP